MNRTPFSSTRRFVFLVTALLACAAIASPASARIGPLKKLKEKVAKKVENQVAPDASSQNAAGDKPVFDDVTLPLTDARIAGILDAFHKSQKITAGRPALVAQRNKASDERGKLLTKDGEAIQNLRSKRNEVERCYQDGYQAAQDKKSEEYKARAMSDPALREKFMKASMEYNAAAAKGDSVAVQKLQATLFSEMLPSKEDSAAVRKSCGVMPPKSAAEIRSEDLNKQIASIDEEIRKIDEQAQNESAGMNRQQWGMALERIQLYLEAKKAKKAPRQFTDEEIQAIEKRLSELKEAIGS
ncbi:MAG: hypothetical protein ACM3PF_02520 [Bacteroidota bacterium]